MKCLALTLKGTECTRKCKEGHDYCGFHYKKVDIEKDMIIISFQQKTLSFYDLNNIQKNYEFTKLIHLHDFIPSIEDRKLNEAGILIIKNYVTDHLYKEQKGLDWDKMEYRRGRIVNKKAKYALKYNHLSQEPDYPNNKERIINFNDMPMLNQLKIDITKKLNLEDQMSATADYYYNMNTCGTSYHTTTNNVFNICLGSSIQLHYQWFLNGKPLGDNISITLNHGDLYFISDKASGHDYKRKKIPTLKFAFGCDKYTKIKNKV